MRSIPTSQDRLLASGRLPMASPGASEASRALQAPVASWRPFQRFPCRPCESAAARGQIPLKGPPEKSPKIWVRPSKPLCRGFGVFPSRGKSMYIVGWLEPGLCLPMYGRSSEGLYTSILHRLLPSSTGVMADVYLQCLTTLVMGGNGLSRPGGHLRFRV